MSKLMRRNETPNQTYARLMRESRIFLKDAAKFADQGLCQKALGELRAATFREAQAYAVIGTSPGYSDDHKRIFRRWYLVARSVLRKCGGGKAPTTGHY